MSLPANFQPVGIIVRVVCKTCHGDTDSPLRLVTSDGAQVNDPHPCKDCDGEYERDIVLPLDEARRLLEDPKAYGVASILLEHLDNLRRYPRNPHLANYTR